MEYWRESLILAGRIEGLGNDKRSAWIELAYEDLQRGEVPAPLVRSLEEKYRNSRGKGDSQNRGSTLNVAISSLRIVDEEYGRSSEPLDLMLIPAKLKSNGTLEAMPGQLPWIPREHLEPSNNDRNPTISSVARVDKFFHAHTPPSGNSFHELWSYSLKFFRFCCGERLSSFTVDDYRAEPSAFIRVYQDATGATGSLVRVLDEVLDGKRHPGMLLELCANRRRDRKLYERSKFKLFSFSRRHIGHFSPTFALAPSQRIAVHRFLETEDEQVFCVNGPPGTGKTTVLQSFIATEWVRAALELRESPPIQVVCGATNQSVLNVIDCFENEQQSESFLAARWIPQVHSYGTFCASFSKSEKVRGYQIEHTDGTGFSSDMEDLHFIDEAERYFLNCFAKQFEPVNSVAKAGKMLHKLLQTETASLGTALTSALDMKIRDSIIGFFWPLHPEQIRALQPTLEPFDATLRHRCFLLATHYWEARWITTVREELLERERQRGGEKRGRLTAKDWQRRAMITPAFVSTLSMAGRFFGGKANRDAPPIDVLYFDEAGQIPPEQGGPITALASKLVVIGDTAQLKPYTRIPPNLDEATLQSARLLRGREAREFTDVVKAGFSASSSNLMQLAVQSCRREDGQIIGASLEEHRRSVPEIVAFCNRLSYYGRLIPLRPALSERILPAFGFIECQGASLKVGQSRKNVEEARLITAFIAEHEIALSRFYQGLALDEILAILTPFTAQVRELEKALRHTYPKLIIGTVNSLQGAERPVVLFSPAYDEKNRGTMVFDAEPRLLNVAVSRAKDSFIVVGNRQIFTEGEDALRPGRILGQFLFANPENVLTVRSQRASLGDIPEDEQTRLATLEQHQDILAKAFQIAETELLIASPTISIHAIEADGIAERIREALGRGVHVVIFTDASLDAPEGQLKPAAKAGRELLIEAGAELLISDRIHNKSLAVDELFIVEGSFNWLSAVRTAGSANQKHETSYLIKGPKAPKLIGQLKRELYARTKKHLKGKKK